MPIYFNGMNEEEYIKATASKIKDVRLGLGIKQIDLAIKIGIEDSALRRIESGKTNPSLRTLYRIAGALGVDVQDLLP